MDLVENYLASVRPLLPGDQRDDIIEELEGVLRGRIEDKAAELGRPLSKAETEAVLAAYGHPFLVAGRYGPQHTLIGPELFPLWWLGARVALAADVIVHVAQAAAIFFTVPESANLASRMATLWGGFFSFGFTLIGALTVALAVVERFKLEPFGAWKADGSNGFSGLAGMAGMTEMRGESRKSWKRSPSRVESGGAVIGSLFGLVFWAALPWIHDWGPSLLGPLVIVPMEISDAVGVRLGPICFPVLWSMILTSTIIDVFAHLVEFVRPSERSGAMLMRAGASALGIATVLVAMTNGPVATVTADSLRAARIVHYIDLALWLTVLCYGISLAFHLWRFIDLRQSRAAALRKAQSSGAVTG